MRNNFILMLFYFKYYSLYHLGEDAPCKYLCMYFSDMFSHACVHASRICAHSFVGVLHVMH